MHYLHLYFLVSNAVLKTAKFNSTQLVLNWTVCRKKIFRWLTVHDQRNGDDQSIYCTGQLKRLVIRQETDAVLISETTYIRLGYIVCLVNVEQCIEFALSYGDAVSWLCRGVACSWLSYLWSNWLPSINLQQLKVFLTKKQPNKIQIQRCQSQWACNWASRGCAAPNIGKHASKADAKLSVTEGI